MMARRVDLDRFYQHELNEHAAVLERTRAQLLDPFCRLVDATVAALATGGKLLFFGNGGSAGDAQHLATELTVRYRADRKPCRDRSRPTVCPDRDGNDLGFERCSPARSRRRSTGDVAIDQHLGRAPVAACGRPARAEGRRAVGRRRRRIAGLLIRC
jgi:D-sedoheptulose 7-phosphate isomerase